MKRTNAEHPMPYKISYVSDVDQHIFTVTTFATNSLDIINETHHDDRIEIFNFLLQTFMPVTESSTEPRVKPHPTNQNQFQIVHDRNCRISWKIYMVLERDQHKYQNTEIKLIIF